MLFAELMAGQFGIFPIGINKRILILYQTKANRRVFCRFFVILSGNILSVIKPIEDKKISFGGEKMNEKTRKRWRLVALLTADLILLILISTCVSLRAQAVRLGDSGERVAAIQQILSRFGAYQGEINGRFDLATRRGIKAFQRKNGLNVSGEADGETLKALGIDSKSDGGLFSVQAEILAAFIQKNTGGSYPEMLGLALKTLSEAGNLTLCRYIINTDPEFVGYAISSEPSSDAFSAAIQAINIDMLSKAR